MYSILNSDIENRSFVEFFEEILVIHKSYGLKPLSKSQSFVDQLSIVKFIIANNHCPSLVNP